jgi:hypothetical protein
MGKQNFKNLREPIEVFELASGHSVHHTIDPVCKMLIREKENAVVHPYIPQLRFCNATCRDIYMHATA